MQQAATPPAGSTNTASPSGSRPTGDPAARLNPKSAQNTDSVLAAPRGTVVRHNYLCDGPAPGNLWFRWAYGSEIAAKNRDPRVQVMAYNEDTYVLRENVCVHGSALHLSTLWHNAAC